MTDNYLSDIMASIPNEIWEAFIRFTGAFSLFIMILVISIWKKVGMERIFIIAMIRGFTQLMILASVLFFLFQVEGLLPLFGVLLVMITFGARTAAQRVQNIHNVFKIEFIALFVGVNLVMISMSTISVLPVDDPAFWIPIGGMVTGNSMNISYLSLDRIQSDINNKKEQINAALSLGVAPDEVLQKL